MPNTQERGGIDEAKEYVRNRYIKEQNGGYTEEEYREMEQAYGVDNTYDVVHTLDMLSPEELEELEKGLEVVEEIQILEKYGKAKQNAGIEKEVSPENTQSQGQITGQEIGESELLEKVRSALKIKPRQFLDKDGNPINIIKGGFDAESWNKMVDDIINLIYKGIKASEAVAQYLSNQAWFKSLSKENQDSVKEQLTEDVESAYEKAKSTTEKREYPTPEETGRKRKSETLGRVEALSNKRVAARIKRAENYYYNVLPNEQIYKAVKELFEKYSLEEITADFLDPEISAQMYAPIKRVIGLELLDRYNNRTKRKFLEKQGITDKAEQDAAMEEAVDMFNKVAYEYAEVGKESARATQVIRSLEVIGRMGGVMAKLYAKKIIAEQNQRLRDINKKKMEEMASKLKSINTDAIEEVLQDENVRKVVGKILEKYMPPKPTTESVKVKAKTNLNQERINQLLDKKKALLEKIKTGGYLTSGGLSPEKIELAATNIELGARTFAEFSKQMIKDLGKAVKPYLYELYKQGKSMVEVQGGELDGVQSNTDASAEFAAMFDEKDVKGLVGKTIEENLENILREGRGEAQRKETIQKITDLLGLEPADAAAIVDKVNKEFDARVKAKQEGLKKKLLKGLDKQPRERKEAWEKLADAARSGILADDDLQPYIEKTFGIKDLSEKDANEIERIAENIQAFKEGSPFQTREMYRLAQKLNSLSPFVTAEILISVYYGNILSGRKTQAGNLVSNIAKNLENTATDAVRAISKGDIKFLTTGLKGLLFGLTGEGVEGFKSAMLTGKIPTREKIKGFRGIEDWNPTTLVGKAYQQVKYVTRLMGGVDAMFYEPAKYRRAFQLAYEKTRRENKGMPSSEVYQKFINDIYNGDPSFKAFMASAQADYEERIKQIEDDTELSEKQKRKQYMEAAIDRNAQAYYYLFGGLPENIQEESKQYAKRATYTQTPEGFIGLLALVFNSVIQRVPLMQRVIPFVNIIGNVANDALNYGNFGVLPIARSVTEKGSVTESVYRFLERNNISIPGKYKFNEKTPLTADEKADLRAKAVLGFALSVAAMATLLKPKDDDDDEFDIFVTGAGPYSIKERDELMAQGYRPYTIKIGDSYVSYKYSPFVLLLGLVGNIQDEIRYKRKDDSFDVVFTNALVRTYKRTFFDMTFLTGLADLFSYLNNRNNQAFNADTALGKLVSQTIKTQVIPFSNFIQQSYNDVLDYLDQPMPQTKRSKASQTFVAESVSGLPIISNYVNLPRRNALGEPIKTENDLLVTESATFYEPSSKATHELFAEKSYRPNYPYPNEVNIVDSEGIKNITEQEYDDFMQFRGAYVKYVVNKGENLNKLKGYPKREGEYFPFKEEMSKIFSDADEYAKAYIVNQRAKLVPKLNQNILNDIGSYIKGEDSKVRISEYKKKDEEDRETKELEEAKKLIIRGL